ncbi:hypothetical protein C2I18_15625 [Paenibacillus sp. PK3_47]|nr:hypothetical protein C2I18_15625 [Paenibacillus sp. PK3_47]
MKNQITVYEQYKSEIYRIGWRVQYRSKKITNHECSFLDNVTSFKISNASHEDDFCTRALLDTLPPQGKLIIEKLYYQDLTEAEVSRQLHISQQAVNKWKRKMINQLSQMMNL